MKRRYIDKNFRKASLALIEQANEIVETYIEDGYNLTLRQLYYQFVAKDLFPEDRKWRLTESGKWVRDPNGTKNAEPNYDWIGDKINDGRLAGLVDWDVLVDRTRKYESKPHWDNPASVLNTAAKIYGIDTREDQDEYLEVWVEKDALGEIIERACRPLDVGYLAVRGFISQSAMKKAAERFVEADSYYETTLIYLGDHDPSGMDISRDIQDRLKMFGSKVIVERIALNMDQIEQYQPPPFPTKTKDSRSPAYVSKYGEDCWELDALEPQILTELTTEAIEQHTQFDLREAKIERQEQERAKIIEFADNWT